MEIVETTETVEYLTQSDSDVESLEGVVTIRGKWMLDGCETLEGVVERLEEEKQLYLRLIADGWKMCEPVEDDYGGMAKEPADMQLEPAA